ncbi:MAG: AraC family transcriptional regulator [Opitutales bacterium]|nr:AraC family transcriptional regulator [Opitutales bacterium]MCH8541654.1 helix-turn-helix domain-containing protein [Opitutales bacterium]
MAISHSDQLSMIAYCRRVNTRVGNAVNHCDGLCCAWYVESGQLTLRVEQQTWSVGPGQWVFLTPFQRRDQIFREGTVLRSLRFQFPDPLYWRGFHPVRVESSSWSDRARFDELSQKVLQELAKPLTWEAWAARQECFFSWLKAWLGVMEDRSSQGSLASGERSVGLMLHALGGLKGLQVDYQELTRLSGWSRSQIDRQFRQLLGMTPRKWLEQRVWRDVEYALLTTSEPLKSLAYRFGFTDPAHFTHWFKARTGIAPGQYREGKV